MNGPRSRFTTLAWLYVGYLLLVIMFGDVVRITGSGAGCGNHWPLCDGQVVPQERSVKLLIELTHRVTSGLCGIISIGLATWAWRCFGRAHATTRAALAALGLVLVEGAIGAALVKLELVDQDTSTLRAVVIALHLANTLLLTGAATLTAHWSTDPRIATRPRVRTAWFGAALLGLAITCMAGAVTALGDTLFPVGSVAAARAAHTVLVQLRLFHPVIAVVSALGAGALAIALRAPGSGEETTQWSSALLILLLIQTLFGFANIAMAAPGWAQIVHLLLAQLLWIAAVLMTSTAHRRRAA